MKLQKCESRLRSCRLSLMLNSLHIGKLLNDISWKLGWVFLFFVKNFLGKLQAMMLSRSIFEKRGRYVDCDSLQPSYAFLQFQRRISRHFQCIFAVSVSCFGTAQIFYYTKKIVPLKISPSVLRFSRKRTHVAKPQIHTMCNMCTIGLLKRRTFERSDRQVDCQYFLAEPIFVSLDACKDISTELISFPFPKYHGAWAGNC